MLLSSVFVMVLLVAANVGLRGQAEDFDSDSSVGPDNENNDVSASVKSVLRNIHDGLMLIRQKHNVNPAILGLQEDGGYNLNISPFFEEPLANDYDITTGTQGQGKNGVSTYCNLDTCQSIQPVDSRNEMVTITFSYRKAKGLMVKAAYINLYRNIHRNHERSLDETVAALKKTIRTLRRDHSVNKVIIQGDFNSEDLVSLGNDFREISNSSMFHKHNSESAKKKIDRVFVNFHDVGILEVLETFENKRIGNEDGSLGHKPVVLWIGAKPIRQKARKVRKICFKKLKSNLKNKSPGFEDFSSNGTEVLASSEEMFDKMCIDFYEKTQKIAKDSTVGKKMKYSGPEAILLNSIEKHEAGILHGKRPANTLIKSVNSIRKGLEGTSKVKPSMEKLGKKLENKISKLNKTDIELGKKVVEDIFNGSPGIEAKRFRNAEEAKKVFMSVSNSGATDEGGISLKITKAMIDYNKEIFDRFRSITDSALTLGIFPKVWTKDVINFIFKNKGDRSDAANWRPITIAPSFGKHIEKVISYSISGMDDMNYDNHAYKSGKACMTAITRANEVLTQQIIKARRNCPKGKKFACFLTADDIAGAFESVDHQLIGYALEIVFRRERFFKLKDLLLSYLDRKSTVVDRDSSNTYEIAKTFKDRSIPQGSILSPLLWRIYDCIFSKLYTNCFNEIMKEDKNIVDIAHLSYADDHLTIFTMYFDDQTSCRRIGRRASLVFDTLRRLLKAATSQMGCDINPLKSESIVPKIYADHIKLELVTEKAPSCTFKWLGYHLKIDDNHQLTFVEEEVRKRLNSIQKFRDICFRYTCNICIKWKVYKVFIAPFIELYLPIVIQHKALDISIIHNLQHRSMCLALGLPRTTCRREIEIRLGERSVEEKAKRMATRIITVLDIKRPVFLEHDICKRLRSGKIANNPTTPAYRTNFILRLFIYQDLRTESTAPVQFDSKKVNKWAKSIRLTINKKKSSH